MSNQSDFNIEGKPLRIHDLDIEKLALYLNENKVRTTQGKMIMPLHEGHRAVLQDPARFKVLACGRRWGKCSDIDDVVTLADGSLRTYGELIGHQFEVWAKDEQLNDIKVNATCVDNGKKPVYKIKTKYGLELLRTENHPLFTSEGWGSIDDGSLVEGVRIAVPRKLPQQGTIRKDSKLVELVAYLLADGCINRKTCSFTNNNNGILENSRNFLDGSFREKLVENKTELFLDRNNSIYNLIESLGLDTKTSYDKFIPNWIYTCPNDQISMFLNRLYSCAGWVSTDEIGYCSVSKKLAKDVKRLLARLGIVSNLTKKELKSGPYTGNAAYQVKINNYSELIKFREKVGILGKEIALDKCINKSKNSFNSQLETIPKELCSHFSNTLKSTISHKTQEKVYGIVRPDRANSRKRLQKYCSLYKGCPDFDNYSKFLKDDLYWDEIVSIEYIGDRQTAGLSVPKYHNYVGDCLEHNTLITSLMALSVLFQVNRRVWIVAPDYGLCEKVFRELYSILVTQLQIIKPGKRGGGRARNQKGDYYLETPWGSVLEAKSMENPDSLAGEANDLVIVDEAALQPNMDDIWTQMLRPTIMDKEGSAIFISTPRGKNGFYKLFLQGEMGLAQRNGEIEVIVDEKAGIDNNMTDWSCFQRTSYDNPLLSSNPEKSKKEVDAAYRNAVMAGKLIKFKQEYLADFESVSDTCFPGFRTRKTEECEYPHVIDYNWHPDEGPIFAACDHNFAKPASTIFAQVNKFGDVVIFDERFTEKTTTYMQAQQIKDEELYLNKKAYEIWNKEKPLMKDRGFIRFKNVIADISGDQRQLNGRSAWDDFQDVLGYRPTGLKQPRDIGCNMIRLWMNYPQFDKNGSPLLDENGTEVTVPKLFISRNCVNLITALDSARFKKGKNDILKEDYDETPEGYEGLLDALRYLLVHLFHDTGQHMTVMQGF